ncbi:hypothetical protein F5884DRAFT_193407 [Xylogone sp. PMI_703]|nr:hypothetical protein F5884DRAFT_193407 [Xylogone sp. PMI_703]
METKAAEAEHKIDSAYTKDEALQNAIQAVELYMKATKLASNDEDRTRLRRKCKQLLSRAEEIKASPNWTTTKKEPFSKIPLSERALTKQEQLILLESSRLNGFVFPAWQSEPDNAVFDKAADNLYTEASDLNLSQVQNEIFDGWKRPKDIFGIQDAEFQVSPNEEASAMDTGDGIDLVQDITTDCSVVASLCACTARGSKGIGTFLASTIYPYDKSKNRPRISANGKYIFRLHFNGCSRRVTIDDRLPSSNSSRKLHVVDRNNPKLMWPALVEKAYLKVRGGYDFPGSNSGTDLWVLTGWIPEQIFLQSDDLQLEQLWTRISKSFGYGDVMITLGTGRLTSGEEKVLGLVGEHDYAVLDMKDTGSQRLLLVKNPWCEGVVWKGPQATKAPDPPSLENSDWTGDLRDALPSEHAATTPGSFWMRFEEVGQNFESLYLNWNPGLFKYRQDWHFSWSLPQINVPGSFIQSPQYAVTSVNKGPLWILLSRHFTTGEREISQRQSITLADKSSALGFISLYVFEANGRRVYLSDDPFYRGSFVDSPQTLARIEAPGPSTYTVVVAQHGLPLPKYSFTLSLFSRSPVSVAPAIDNHSHSTVHTGAWTHSTAGGNASASSYPLNPQFSITVQSRTGIRLLLETDAEELAVHVKMVWSGGERVTTVAGRDIVGQSGDYRRGCALADLQDVQPGKYTIVCSTFEPGQTGNFTLRVSSTVACEVRPLLPETAGRLSIRLPVLRFTEGVDRMLAPVTSQRLTRLKCIARCNNIAERPSQPPKTRSLLRLSLELGQGPDKTVLDFSNHGDFSDAPMGIRTSDVDLSPEMSRLGNLWIVVERLSGRVGVDEVYVELLSEGPVTVEPWGTGE